MPTEEPIIEEDVREVRCAVTGVPLPSIPAWYAGTRVKFISDAVRQRSTRSSDIAAPAAADPVDESPSRGLLVEEEEATDTTLLEEGEDEAEADLETSEPLETEEEA